MSMIIKQKINYHCNQDHESFSLLLFSLKVLNDTSATDCN